MSGPGQRPRAFLVGTLRGRLVLSVALVHALMMSLFTLDATLRQRNMLLGNQTIEALGLSESLAVSAAVWMASDEISGMQELIEAQKRYPEMRYCMLADTKGFVLAHSDRSKIGLYLTDLPTEARGTVISRSAELVDAVFPVELAGRQLGWARVGLGQGTAEGRLRTIVLLGSLYALGAILIGSIVAWLLGRVITRRLYAVQETMARVRRGDRSARSNIRGVDEPASIAGEFNAMLDMLDERDRALSKSELRLRSLVDGIQAAVVLHGPDSGIVLCNPAAQRLLGLSSAEMAGRTATDRIWRFLRDDGTPMPVEEYPANRVLATRKPVRDTTVGVLRAGGAEPVWALVNADPDFDSLGAISGVVVTFIDITERRRVEKALAESEEMHRSLITAMAEGIVYESEGGRITAVNPAAERILGRGAAEILGMAMKDADWGAVHEDGSPFPAELQPAMVTLETGRPQSNVVMGIHRPDGELAWISINSMPLAASEGGKPRAVITTFRDITEAKRTGEALIRRERELSESQRLALIGSWDWDAITDTIWWSDEYYHIYDIMPGSPTPKYAEHLKAYTRESAARLDAAVSLAMSNGVPYELDLELARPTPDTRWIVARGEVKRDGKGAIVGLRGTAQNITQRKRVEADFRALTARYELILKSAGEGIYGTDREGTIVFINSAAEAILGYASDEAVGRNSHLLFHHTKADGSPYPIEECPLHRSLLDGEASRATDEHFWTKDGRAIPVEHVNTAIVDQGAVVGAVVVFRDITEHKRAEEAIRKLNESLETRVKERMTEAERKGRDLRDSQAALMNIVEDLNEKTRELETANEKLQDLDRLKSMFIASMSHELRTPLNSVIGFSSIMLNEWIGPLTTEQKENLAVILRSGRHLLALINDVIDVSKIEAGKVETVLEAFDIHDVIMEAAEAFAADIRKKELAIETRTIHLPMRGDRRRILQCLLNLVSNAVKYTDAGKITIVAETVDAGRTLRIGVRDTGIGITAEDLTKLFSPFFRIVVAQRAVVPGTGLGLYLTKKLAEEVLEGEISVDSVYGEGSLFALSIPLTARRLT
jgi:PAS domain S-box-containing protein